MKNLLKLKTIKRQKIEKEIIVCRLFTGLFYYLYPLASCV